MYIQPFLFYGVAAILLSLLAIVGAIVVLYFRALRAFSAVETEFTLYKRDNEKQAREALVGANAKAQEIIRSTQLFTDEMKNAVLNAVSQSSATGQSTYQQILAGVGNKSVGELIALSANLKDRVAKEAEGLTQQLKIEVAGEQQNFHQAIQKGEVEVLKDLQERATKMLPDVLKTATKRSISHEDSEQLVVEALQEIKKKHGFS